MNQAPAPAPAPAQPAKSEGSADESKRPAKRSARGGRSPGGRRDVGEKEPWQHRGGEELPPGGADPLQGGDVEHLPAKVAAPPPRQSMAGYCQVRWASMFGPFK